MYRLTPRMLQHFYQDLGRYHDLFSSKRCSGWELEELIYRAIRSDNTANHQVHWQEAGHDDKADLRVQVSGNTYLLQIKSGKITKNRLTLSGHRLGRFEGNLAAISDYLNERKVEIVAVPHRKDDGERGREHIYCVTYLDYRKLSGLSGKKWAQVGKQLRQTNEHGVEFSLRPTMSWQIWWKIPEELLIKTREIVIG